MFKVDEIIEQVGQITIMIYNCKQFAGYLKGTYNLKNNMKKNWYIEGWGYRVTVSKPVWEIIKNDQYLKNLPLVPLEKSKAKRATMDAIINACPEPKYNPSSPTCLSCALRADGWCNK